MSEARPSPDPWLRKGGRFVCRLCCGKARLEAREPFVVTVCPDHPTTWIRGGEVVPVPNIVEGTERVQ